VVLLGPDHVAGRGGGQGREDGWHGAGLDAKIRLHEKTLSVRLFRTLAQ
jgi:hypothetical protein